jgi:protein associated with RNAse G/E
MVDLDLDLLRTRADRRIELQDQDEFVANTDIYGYPADVIEGARSTARELYVAINDDAEPFRSYHQAWLGRITE